MKIKNVQIENWESPGAQWWDAVAAKPDEPLIEATITLTLSHREYHELLDSCRGKTEEEDHYCRHGRLGLEEANRHAKKLPSMAGERFVK